MRDDLYAPHPACQLLQLGAAQAVLFVLGALLGRGIGLVLNLDAFGQVGGGYGTREIIGILLIGLGGGTGAQLGRRWYVRKYGTPRV